MPADERQGERTVPEARRPVRVACDHSLCIEQRPAFERPVCRVPLKLTENSQQSVAARECPQPGRRLAIVSDRLVQVAHGQERVEELEAGESGVDLLGQSRPRP